MENAVSDQTNVSAFLQVGGNELVTAGEVYKFKKQMANLDWIRKLIRKLL